MSPIAINSLDELAAAFSLSEAEADLLRQYDESLVDSQAHTNLIARPSFEDRWTRHYADSIQLFDLIPANAKNIIDIGSGAGFPGLILAVLARFRRPELQFTLVDSVQKKARFIDDAANRMGLMNVSISGERAEVFHVKHSPFDVVMARAVASLTKLLPLTAPILAEDGLLIFPKGEKAETELMEAKVRWTFRAESRPSMTHDRAQILLIRCPEPRH